MLRALDHVQLAMPRGGEAQARAFYAGPLGLEEEPKPEALARRGGCWFARGRLKIHLGVEEPFAPARKAHPALLTEDLETLAVRLTAVGAPVEWDHTLPDRRRFYATDPFGNRMEFMAAGDGFSER